MITTHDYDGVLRIEVTRKFPRFPVNYFFIDGLLIDTGSQTCGAESTRFFQKKGLVPALIVNTHYHPDHTGADSHFVKRFGSHLLAHRLAVPRLAHPKSPFLLSVLLHGTPGPSSAEEVPLNVKTPHHDFSVIEIPGHSDDHIALYEKEKKWIFSGDLVLEGRPREVFVDVKIFDAIESLRKLSMLDIKMLFCGHGRPIMNPRDSILEKIEFLERLGRRVEELKSRGLDRIQIRRKIFGHESAIAYLSQKKFSAQNLVDSYLAER